MSTARRSARTAADVERGLLPAAVRVSQPHWYLTIQESGCLLCGAGGRTQRIRMPGRLPKDPAKCYVIDERDWICGSHFA